MTIPMFPDLESVTAEGIPHPWTGKLQELDLSVRTDIEPLPERSKWALGERLILVVADPHDWEEWVPVMRSGWAVVYWADTTAALVPSHPDWQGIVALQPIPYLAAHIVEAFSIVYPDEEVRQL